jgi:hypothetical protein
MKMKKNNKKVILKFLIFAFAFIYAVNVYGQSKTGTTVGQFLKIEPSARVSAIGNAGAALQGEAVAAFFNPASLGRLENSDFQFTHNNWIADINYNYAIGAIKTGSLGTFSVQVTSLNSGEIDVRTVEQPLGTGERYTVTNFALGVGYGIMLTDRVSVGMQANYIQESIWHSDLTAFGFNFGVQYEVAKGGLLLGASVSNFGPRAGYNGRDLYINYDFDSKKNGDNDHLPAELRTDSYSLPTIFRVGLAYPVKIGESNSVLIAVEATHPNDNYESVNIGAEWTLFNVFSIRGGYRDLFLNDSEGGFMLGAGAKVEVNSAYNIRFDYAWGDYGRLEQAHRFTVGIGF